MSYYILYKSYDCDCSFVQEEDESLQELKAKAKSGELVVQCQEHENYMYPKADVDDY